MPTVRLRIQHATTFVQETIGDWLFADGEIERLASIEARLQTVGELAVVVEVDTLLGSARKPLAPGRHRATLEVDRAGVWKPLIDGTISNERAAHGRSYGGVRRWSLTLVDDAVDVAWQRLEGVNLRAAAEQAASSAGRYDMEWCSAQGDDGSGNALAVVPRAAWGVDTLTALAFTAAALPAPTATPGTLASVLPGITPTVALCSPRPVPGSPAGYRNVPAWTGAQLVELRCEAEQLVLEASYAAWPAAAVGAVALRPASARIPAPGTPAFAALVSLDDDGTGEPWHDDYDWSTEPGDTDGKVLDDFALGYLKGPDGSLVDQADVLELPLQATYAARVVALSGTRAPGRDGGRTVENKQHLELPVLLAPVQAATAAGTAFETVTIGAYAVDVSRPIFDLGKEEPDESAVYLVSLVDRGGQWRAVAERRGADGRGVCETWARELYPALAYAVGDAEVVGLTVPSEAVPEDAVRLGDALAGVRFEGLGWIVRSLTRREDVQEAELSLARPAGAESVAEGTSGPGSGPGGSGRIELPPTVVAGAYQTLEQDDQGQAFYWVDAVQVDVAVPAEADTPAAGGFEVETETSPGVWQPVGLTAVRQKSVEVHRSVDQSRPASPAPAANPNPFEGQAWRARCRYPSGTVTDWTITTAT